MTPDTPRETGTKLSPTDFTTVLENVPTDWVLIGGQAIAVWARRYHLSETVTSKDIDFWGAGSKLRELARKLNSKVLTPTPYDRTALTGAVHTIAAGKRTVVELLSRVPGLDDERIEKVAIPLPITAAGTRMQILTPVSLTLTKLYALRHFDQKDRNDLEHLKIAIKAAREFIREICEPRAKFALWNCNRILTAHKNEKYRQLEKKDGFKLLDSIPIDKIHQLAGNPDLPDHQRFKNFLNQQWARSTGVL